MKIKKFFTLLLLTGLVFSCSDDDPPPPPAPVLSTEANILTFTLTDQTGPATLNASAATVEIEVENGTDLSSLSPAFTVSAGASASPASGTSGDYSSAVTITVTAEDGTTTKGWTVNVTEAPASTTDILTFTMPGQTSAADINSDDHTVTIEVAEGTDVTSLAPTFTISEGATSDPVSETEGDYTNPVIITVTAEDGTTSQDWTVTVSVATGQGDGTDILTFSYAHEQQPAVIDAVNHTIDLVVKNDQDLTRIYPYWSMSEGATSVPLSGSFDDYSSPFIITVTAEDGTTTQEWTVNASIADPGNDTDILAFNIAEETGNAIINDIAHTIAIEVENGTDLTDLTPIWTLSDGATSSPESGTTSDYSSEFTITVTAQDGTTTQDWAVNVTEAPGGDATDILLFLLDEQTSLADINDFTHTVDIEVVNGTDLTNLTPTFLLSPGATSNPVSGTAGNYSSPVTIAVTAEDGTTTQDWTVTVNEAPGGTISSETDILTFEVPEQTGDAVINGIKHEITVEVANGTYLGILTPTYTLSPGATSVPASGTPYNYFDWVTIFVTAEDGTTRQEWLVKVTEAD